MATAPAPSFGTGLAAWRTQPIVAGALAGIVGGIVFGLLMALLMPPMLGMIGSLLGVPDLGWLVHLGFSALIGAGFGAALQVLGRAGAGWGAAAAYGLAYGLLWWVLGPLLLMPTWMGMGPQLGAAFSGDNLLSLGGHLLYGLVTGLVYRAITR